MKISKETWKDILKIVGTIIATLNCKSSNRKSLLTTNY